MHLVIVVVADVLVAVHQDGEVGGGGIRIEKSNIYFSRKYSILLHLFACLLYGFSRIIMTA